MGEGRVELKNKEIWDGMRCWLDLPRPLILLAPMAGVTDWAFREVCYQLGAEITVSHQVPARGVALSPRALLPTIGASHGGRPFLVQLFGREPEQFRRAARILTDELPIDGIDVNMGCPAREVVASGNGSALLREPELAVEIVAATCAGTQLPVSVKLRIGWDRISVPELAPMLEAAGARAITVHGRTREQQYKGTVNLTAIAEIKRAVGVPVIGNGDVTSLEAAIGMLEATDADGVMVGRGAMGNPWLFAQLLSGLQGNDGYLGAWPNKAELIRYHVGLAFESQGEQAALTLRKHLMAYTRCHPASARLRRMVERLQSRGDVDAWVDAFEALAAPTASLPAETVA